ncbi:hypothetical protein ENUP19_0085G0135 [Entamoeba nuttalli]|uniref:Protein kinase, putative n=2 Tax=Entamoeba nuttalli TaxID=412467 RepID=K2HY28_ENTNP|nr:protein kinase, putative [Entamoeba nuttalli P19]EKE41230.1 protein kinase, putative [Entamoeba nuttalli P19]|eukprot:XP_008856436.1 protein kinase, putative [Entamoeba nuttalli P19]
MNEHLYSLIIFNGNEEIGRITIKKEQFVYGRNEVEFLRKYIWISRQHFQIEIKGEKEKKEYVLTVKTNVITFHNNKQIKRDIEIFINSLDIISIPIPKTSIRQNILFISKEFEEKEMCCCFYTKYQIIKFIGSGSFGKVFQIKRKSNNKINAVKIIDITQKKKSEIAQRESEVLEQIHHQNIIKKYETIQSQRFMYIIMEYIEGLTLEQYLQLKQHHIFNENEIKIIIRQVFNAINYLHSNKIIHRDLKLENIMIRGKTNEEYNKLNIVVMDFGLGKILETKEYTLTKCGTSNYTSPQILQSGPYDGFKTDIWCCGVMLFYMSIGMFPFNQEGVNSSLILRVNIRNGKICHQKEFNMISLELQDLIKNMLMVDEQKRFTIQQCLSHEFVSLKHQKT